VGKRRVDRDAVDLRALASEVFDAFSELGKLVRSTRRKVKHVRQKNHRPFLDGLGEFDPLWAAHRQIEIGGTVAHLQGFHSGTILGVSGFTVVCGNPRPRSRTLEAATLIATRLRDGATPDLVIDLVDVGPRLLEFGAVADLVAAVCASSHAVIASPTYKASYTGLLKLFLDQFAAGSMAGVITFPLMLGGAMNHALAPEAFLKPVLAELGASCPMPGLYLLETDYTSEAVLGPWLERAKKFV
jgi:FMN reductase